MARSQDSLVLVTGASGYLATHCVHQLLNAGYKVRGTVRSLKNEEKIAPLKALKGSERLQLVEADLTSEHGWDSALKDVTFVLHTASPLPGLSSADESTITTAVSGVLNVLKAAAKAPTVKRVILTSSGLAILDFDKLRANPNYVYSEADWPENLEKLITYAVSKVKAERAAWDFVKQLTADQHKFELVVINPFLIFGPTLTDTVGTSLGIVQRFLTKPMAKLPKISIPSVDVRDVAKAHILAMTAAGAAGERIAVVYQPSYWMTQLGRDLSEEFSSQGFDIPTEELKEDDDRSALDPQTQAMLKQRPYGADVKVDTTKMKKILGMDKLIDMKTSVIDSAYSMFERNIVEKREEPKSYKTPHWALTRALLYICTIFTQYHSKMAGSPDALVLVTGASGYLATHCVQQLLNAGYKVRGTVRSMKNEEKIAPLKALKGSERLQLVEADLTSEHGWDSALKDVTFVLHTASPLPGLSSTDESTITTAVSGALNVLKAAAKAPTVKRVILTSSGLAIVDFDKLRAHPDYVYSEADWPENLDKLATYAVSKVKAERAAWDFVNQLSADQHKFELVVINPFLILGPTLTDVVGASIGMVQRFLTKPMAKLPKISIGSVDVRDVAKAHILAMTAAGAAGERIAVVYQPSYWITQMARDLSEEFSSQGFDIPTEELKEDDDRTALDPHMQAMLKQRPFGAEVKVDTAKMKKILGMDKLIDMKTSVIDSAYSLIERNIVEKREVVLVTGASGYLATHCVQQLLNAGYKVRGTVRSVKNETKIAPLKTLKGSERLQLVEADLTSEHGWDSALKDVTFVLHTASPFPAPSAADESTITTAVSGALNVLKAAAKVSTVKRVVLTSSGLAIMDFDKLRAHPDHVFSEADWPENLDNLATYAVSKVKAERAAWDFVKELTADQHKFELVVINPLIIFGPTLTDTVGSSIAMVQRFLTKPMAKLPKICVPSVDVRDVAKAHILAMTAAGAAGERIVVAYQPSYWMTQMARDLNEEFSSQGFSIPTEEMKQDDDTSGLDPHTQATLKQRPYGADIKFDTAKMKKILGMDKLIDTKSSVIESAYSLIERNIVEKREGYRGPKNFNRLDHKLCRFLKR
uniref:NAD-dependent epimerase/dehydratase domain-containing protein n=1 Tax=Plectus sambesii TaxID=2011161 RepID=A0A914V1H0_9BILA